MYNATDYVLAWPRDLARNELTYLLSKRAGEPQDDTWTARARLVIEEAFAGGDVLRALNSAVFKKDFVKKLLASVDDLPEPEPFRLVWSVRQAAANSRTMLLRQAWADVVTVLRGRGYLEKSAPTPCRKEAGGEPPDVALNRLSEAALVGSNMWPLQPGTWTDDTFYSLVEFVHDHVTRPRGRWKHNLGMRAVVSATTACGWHYRDFATEPGQLLYRWYINRLFEGYGSELRLAGYGESLGRLVRVGPADRAELVKRALASPTRAMDVSHALELWRRRDASAGDKRSAILTLARVLEANRTLLKTELLSKDESALFRIANEFDLRHSNAMQRPDYDEAFLDWVFWWYLATAELTDRLLDRQNAATVP